MEALDAYIESDIVRRRQKHPGSWKHLDLCFKWRLVRQYLVQRNMATSEMENYLREKLRRNELNDCVIFDGTHVLLIKVPEVAVA
jgi:hypothetical protein